MFKSSNVLVINNITIGNNGINTFPLTYINPLNTYIIIGKVIKNINIKDIILLLLFLDVIALVIAKNNIEVVPIV